MQKKQNQTQQLPEETVQKEDTRTEKKPYQKNQKGDRADTTGYKKHPHGVNQRKGSDHRNIKQDLDGNVENYENTGGEERKHDRVRHEKVSQYCWDKSKITLDTPLPEKPKEKELLKEPKREDLNKRVDELEKQMENLKNKKNQKIMDIVDKDKTIKSDLNSKFTPIQQLLKDAFEDLKVKKEEFLKYKAEHEEKDNQVQALFKRQQDLRNKMKKLSNEKDIVSELQKLQNRFNNEQLTNQEEKRIVSQIEELKLSLPFAKPLQELEEEKQELEKQSKALKGKMGAAYKNMKQVQEKIDEYKRDLDDIKVKRQEGDEKSHPEISLIKEEYTKNINDLKEKKHKLYQDFDVQYKAFKDQQELLRYHDYVKRQHDYLRRQEKAKRQEEEKKKREEEEKQKEEQKRKNKYLEFVEIAENLVKYLQKVQGKNEEQKPAQQNQEQEDQSQGKQLKPEDLEKLLKAEKMTVLVSKKDKQDQSKNFFGGGNYKGKNKQKNTQQQQQQNQQQEKTNEIQAIHHTFEILQGFERLEVSAPVFKQDIDAAINQLLQRKQHYEELPNKEQQGETQQQGEEHKEKQQNQRQKKKQQDLDFDETSFPTIN